MRLGDQQLGNPLILSLPELICSLKHIRSSLQHFELKYVSLIVMDTEVVGAFGPLDQFNKVRTLHLDRSNAVDSNVEHILAESSRYDDDAGGYPVSIAAIYPR